VIDRNVMSLMWIYSRNTTIRWNVFSFLAVCQKYTTCCVFTCSNAIQLWCSKAL